MKRQEKDTRHGAYRVRFRAATSTANPRLLLSNSACRPLLTPDQLTRGFTPFDDGRWAHQHCSATVDFNMTRWRRKPNKARRLVAGAALEPRAFWSNPNCALCLLPRASLPGELVRMLEEVDQDLLSDKKQFQFADTPFPHPSCCEIGQKGTKQNKQASPESARSP